MIPRKFQENLYQENLLDKLHENHPGIVKMKVVARVLMWWLNIDSDIEGKVKNCAPCQQNRRPMAKAPPNPWRWPSKPWQRIHIDYAGPIMNKMYLIVVDAHSKWIEVITIASTTSESTINACGTYSQHTVSWKRLCQITVHSLCQVNFRTLLKLI